jgi:hypothetical protein
MRSGPTNDDFPDHGTRAPSGAGDEEVFETKASPPAVAGPLFADSGRQFSGMSTGLFTARLGSSRWCHDQ